MTDNMQDVIRDLAPADDSEVVTAVRDVTLAYAAGEADLETYQRTLHNLRNENCCYCQQVLWKYEVPKADGEGCLHLCHKCYWTSSRDYDALEVRASRSGDVVEFGMGLMMRELMAAFCDRTLSVEYAQAGLEVMRLCAPILQTCTGVVVTPGWPIECCDRPTTERVCPKCGAVMADLEAEWIAIVDATRAREAKGNAQITDEGDENDESG